MVSFNIQLDVGSLLDWTTDAFAAIKQHGSPLTRKYQEVMRELDMHLLRAMSFVLLVATTILVMSMVTPALAGFNALATSVTKAFRSLPSSAWPTILYQLTLAGWFLMCA